MNGTFAPLTRCTKISLSALLTRPKLLLPNLPHEKCGKQRHVDAFAGIVMPRNISIRRNSHCTESCGAHFCAALAPSSVQGADEYRQFPFAPWLCSLSELKAKPLWALQTTDHPDPIEQPSFVATWAVQIAAADPAQKNPTLCSPGGARPEPQAARRP